MNFKEMIASDNDAVFLCPEEFGEPVLINGETAYVIIDDYELEKRKMASVNGMFQGEVLFHINANFFKGVPSANRIIEFNKERHRIESVSEELGILTIVISRNLS